MTYLSLKSSQQTLTELINIRVTGSRIGRLTMVLTGRLQSGCHTVCHDTFQVT